MLQQVNHDHVYSVLSGNAASLDHNYCQVKDTFLIILTTKIRLGSLKKTSRFNPPRAKLIFSVIFKKSSQMQSWADTNVFASLCPRRESNLTMQNVKTHHHWKQCNRKRRHVVKFKYVLNSGKIKNLYFAEHF